MIKRQFYRLEHADGGSDTSSYSSFEPQEETTDESGDEIEEVKQDDQSCSTSSGYVSEDSSVKDVDIDSSGLPSNETDGEAEAQRERQNLIDGHLSGNSPSRILETESEAVSQKDSSLAEFPDSILKCKSVFKCKLCPRIVCLNEESLRAHIKSKRHARSEKLLNEGRLKAMLNSDGELENQDIPAELLPEIVATPPQVNSKKKKNRTWRKKNQNKRSRKQETSESSKVPAKKRRNDES